ncbi:exo-alpha-sialidase [Draconibacterium sp.]|nr:exo-alpha-sialidase [Draconibacterium sp.]
MKTLLKIAFLALVIVLQYQNVCSQPNHTESLIFPFQELHVHGPTVVELPNGDLLSAWFQGSGERWADDVVIMGARLKKGNTEWSKAFVMADVPEFPDINPMLFIDTLGKLWLMWYTVLANQWETSILKYRISSDYEGNGAPVWEWQEVLHVKPGDKTERGIQPGDKFVKRINEQFDEYENYLEEEIFPANPGLKERYTSRWPTFRNMIDSLAKGENQLRNGRIQKEGKETNVKLGYPLYRRIGWQTKNKPFILNKKRLIVPLYSDGLSCTLFAITDDWGNTWQFSNPVIGGIGIQATIAIKEDGTLVAYLRDNGPPPKRIQYTESKDNGLTWSIARDTKLPNSGSGFDMVTLKNGNWLLIYNHSETGRSDLMAAISDNEGATWKWKKNLENDPRQEKSTRFHYPAVIQGANGTIHTTYSYHRNDTVPGKTIKWMKFDIDWLKD